MMTLETTLILADFRHDHDHRPHLAFHEALPGYTIDDAVSDILSGQLNGKIIGVYSIHDGKCEDVSQQVADKIVAAWARSERVSESARDFVDYVGGEIPREEAA